MPPLLLLGTYNWSLTVIPESSRTEGPDVMHMRGARLGIDEVRGLVREANLTPLASSERVFLIAYDDITIEAQNALLKIVEEPPQTSRFYIVVGRASLLLPTLRSRLVLLEREGDVDAGLVFETFMKISYGERLKAIADHATKKDDAWMRELWQGFERHAHEKKLSELMKSVVSFSPHFERPGSSKKMILEQLSLLV